MSSRSVSDCGTNAGYQAHLRANEEPCDLCRSAHASTVLEWGDKNPDKIATHRVLNRVRYRALAELATRHPAEFRSLLKKHKESPS